MFFHRALQQEQEITSKLRDTIQDERHSQQDTVHREQVAIADLQAMVDLERSKMMDMQRALEREKVRGVTVCSWGDESECIVWVSQYKIGGGGGGGGGG